MPLSGRAGPSVSLEFCMPRAKSNVGILDDDVGADDVGRHQGRELDAREDRPLLELVASGRSANYGGVNRMRENLFEDGVGHTALGDLAFYLDRVLRTEHPKRTLSDPRR